MWPGLTWAVGGTCHHCLVISGDVSDSAGYFQVHYLTFNPYTDGAIYSYNH